TDVTGFGLMGHLYEMVKDTDVEALVETAELDVLPSSLSFASMGLLPEGMYRNRDYCSAQVEEKGVNAALCDALFDPQTSGGLLAAVAPQDAEKCLAMLQGKVLSPQRIGTVRPYTGGKRIFLK
ncbi:MAG: selenide, water dikinase SelD, partial [Firmicutes bacterium]|nr:selenide, water dikinase SelD [Bacillota bacterium]